MLFDLRGRGRRRTVQAIYLWLAVLMGGGLIFFGIGGATNGGLLDAFKGGGGGGGGTSAFDSRLKAAEKAVARNPNDAASWAQLTQLRFDVANVPANYDQNGNFTSKARGQLAPVKDAWDHYLTLTSNPSPNLAADVAAVLGPTGIGAYRDAARAEAIVATARPSIATYGQMAQDWYLGGDTRQGDLASAKAVSLAQPSQRATLQSQLSQLKTQAAALRSGKLPTTSAAGSSSSTGAGTGGGPGTKAPPKPSHTAPAG